MTVGNSMTQVSLGGGCRCGAVRVCFAATREIEALPLLICSCEFCRRHRLRYSVDSGGLLQIAVRRGSALRRYSFDGDMAVTLVCARCGTVIGALLAGDGGDLVALNVGCLADARAFTQPDQPLDYDAEPPQVKLERRRRNWTPAVWQEFEA
jgi:hypothetical protein